MTDYDSQVLKNNLEEVGKNIYDTFYEILERDGYITANEVAALWSNITGIPATPSPYGDLIGYVKMDDKEVNWFEEA